MSTLQWIPLPDTSELLIAANGHCASFPYRVEMQNFLRLLADGAKVRISDLDPSERVDAELLTLVASLAEWGAI